MTPERFPGFNAVYAKDQPQYLPLPAHVTSKGVVTTCWKLTFRERLILLFTGQIWLQQMTFGQALQPQLISVDPPEVE